MCATFRLVDDDAEEIRNIVRDIDQKYGEGAAHDVLARDFFPRQPIPVIGPGRKVSLLAWGFPLPNSKQIVFNARAESLAIRPLFRSCVQNRCLIPASWFYEWDKTKKKFRVSFPDSKLLYMAGLWMRGNATDGGRVFFSTIITTEPNAEIAKIHNRMPAIIAAPDVDRWLSGSSDGLDLLRPYEQPTRLEAV